MILPELEHTLPNEMTPGERVQARLQELHIDIRTCALLLGESESNLYDLLAYPDEIDMVWTLDEICRLGKVVALTPCEMVLGEIPDVAVIDEATLDAKLFSAAQSQQLSNEALGETIGWEVRSKSGTLLPIADWNLDMLKAACLFANVDWRGVLKGLA